MLLAAMMRSLTARAGVSAPCCRMVIEYIEGAPEQVVDLKSKVILAPRD